MKNAILVITNFPSLTIANKLAYKIMEKRLAACINIMSKVKSIYLWKGNIQKSTEVTLLIKSTKICYAELESEIISIHPYETPEIIAFPIDGYSSYLKWIFQETKQNN